MIDRELDLFFDTLAERWPPEWWAQYWRDQCELLSASFHLVDDVLDPAARFLRGESLSARLHRDAFAIARARRPSDPLRLAVAIYAAVPALLTGEMHRHPLSLERVAGGEHIRPDAVDDSDGELMVRGIDLRVEVMRRLGYDEAYAKSKAPRASFRRSHMREILF